MSKLYFDRSYVVVIPSYDSEETKMHRHFMLHLFWGNHMEMRSGDRQITGNIICVNSDVMHECPRGEIYGFLLIDPASSLADSIVSNILKDEEISGCDRSVPYVGFDEKSEQDVLNYVRELLSDLGLLSVSKKNSPEPEIDRLVFEIREYRFLGKKISDIAAEMHYSESYLSHIFKENVGCSLKNYLMMCQMEYVWKKVAQGKSITEAAIEAGYASPSHFASICKQMTGISITQAEINTADF